ncbi:MAG: hypothetical protein GY777_17675 [Candidatus Brocadiaceae bacterium]|nr:hypothetical protein [Candidatus Brocadiaceae bacterium]
MLSIEEIKRACELAEGYEVIEPYKERSVFMSCHDLWLKNSLMYVISEDFYNSDFYKLFLQRVIEGINKEYYTQGSRIKPIGIREMPKGLTVFHAVLGWEENFDYDYDYSTIEVKESVVKYVLEAINA